MCSEDEAFFRRSSPFGEPASIHSLHSVIPSLGASLISQHTEGAALLSRLIPALLRLGFAFKALTFIITFIQQQKQIV